MDIFNLDNAFNSDLLYFSFKEKVDFFLNKSKETNNLYNCIIEYDNIIQYNFLKKGLSFSFPFIWNNNDTFVKRAVFEYNSEEENYILDIENIISVEDINYDFEYIFINSFIFKKIDNYNSGTELFLMLEKFFYFFGTRTIECIDASYVYCNDIPVSLYISKKLAGDNSWYEKLGFILKNQNDREILNNSFEIVSDLSLEYFFNLFNVEKIYFPKITIKDLFNKFINRDIIYCSLIKLVLDNIKKSTSININLISDEYNKYILECMQNIMEIEPLYIKDL